MGKRGAASRKEEMAQAQPQTPKPTNASSETEEPNPSPERVERHPENGSPPPPENTNSNLRMQEKSAKPSHSRKRPTKGNAIVRRSLRLRNSVAPVQNRDIEPVYETVSDSETEDEPPLLKEPPLNGTNLEEGQTSGEKSSMEEKMDYLLRLLEKLNSKKKKRSPGVSESPEKRYKSLYINSQKKIEALTNENRELTSKLEVAHAKLEGFEKGTRAFSEVMEKMKDVILVSTVSKATETFMNFSSQAARDALSPQDSGQDRKCASKNKRKKQS